MDLITYSQCAIRFEPNNNQAGGRTYSNRSLIELRHDEQNRYFLRAVDLEKNREEFFNIQIKKPDAYKFGSSADQEDALRSENGIYLFKLKKESRDQFYKELRKIFEKLPSKDEESPKVNPEEPSNRNLPPESLKSRDIEEENEILFDIHDLAKHIQKGNQERVDELIKILIKKGVQLQVEESKKLSNKTAFRIRIQIDGINSKIIGKGDEHSIKVYPSTKVHELRALFEYVYDFPVDHQYFFVNGHLAYAESTMDELSVEENSLFVLFLTEKSLKKSVRL